MGKARRFFRTVVRVEVISEDADVADWDLATVAEQIVSGDLSGRLLPANVTPLTAKECADALVEQGSDPEFFGLTRAGGVV